MLEWAPDGKKVASGSLDGEIRVWNMDLMTPLCAHSIPKAHSKYVTGIAWEPFHRNPEVTRFASSSKDGTVRVWDSRSGRSLFSLCGHTMSVTSVKWSGEGLLITGSQDRTINVYSSIDGKLIRTLVGHGHWINHLALNTDSVLRSGPFDHNGIGAADLQEAQQKALQRYLAVKGDRPERLVSGSDDFTMFLWEPEINKKPVMRLTGHQQPINLVSFSPDGLLFASASFDKSLKIWDALTGK